MHTWHFVQTTLRVLGVLIGATGLVQDLQMSPNRIWGVKAIGGIFSILPPWISSWAMYLLLCTDGLHKHVGLDRLREILLQDRPADETCNRLVGEANRDGGTDNITAVVCRFRDTNSDQLAFHEVEREVGTDPQLADTAEFASKSSEGCEVI